MNENTIRIICIVGLGLCSALAVYAAYLARNDSEQLSVEEDIKKKVDEIAET